MVKNKMRKLSLIAIIVLAILLPSFLRLHILTMDVLAADKLPNFSESSEFNEKVDPMNMGMAENKSFSCCQDSSSQNNNRSFNYPDISVSSCCLGDETQSIVFSRAYQINDTIISPVLGEAFNIKNILNNSYFLELIIPPPQISFLSTIVKKE